MGQRPSQTLAWLTAVSSLPLGRGWVRGKTRIRPSRPPLPSQPSLLEYTLSEHAGRQTSFRTPSWTPSRPPAGHPESLTPPQSSASPGCRHQHHTLRHSAVPYPDPIRSPGFVSPGISQVVQRRPRVAALYGCRPALKPPTTDHGSGDYEAPLRSVRTRVWSASWTGRLLSWSPRCRSPRQPGLPCARWSPDARERARRNNRPGSPQQGYAPTRERLIERLHTHADTNDDAYADRLAHPLIKTPI